MKILRVKITKEVLDKFYFLYDDPRKRYPEYWTQVDSLKKRIKGYVKRGQKPVEYELCVFNYVPEEELYLITDGGHRTEAMRQLYAEGWEGAMDAILIPGTTATGWDNQVARSDEVIRLVEADGLPREIIKQRHYKDKDGKYKTIIRPW